jgi:DNA gyrase/topoisomerase IV subunit A
MVISDSENASELTVKLARLEEQISSLTLELESKKRQMSSLEKGSSEDRKKIADLEAALIIAQQSMLDRTLDIIRSYQQQIILDIDEKGLRPTLDYIQELVKTTESFTKQTKELVNKNLSLLTTTFKTTSDNMYQWPSQSREFLDTIVINKIKIQISELIQQINQYSVALSRFSETKLLRPASFFYNDTIDAAKAIPEKCRSLFQKKLSGFQIDFSKDISGTTKDLVVSSLQELLTMITNSIKKLNSNIKNYIEEHSSRTIDHSLNPA